MKLMWRATVTEPQLKRTLIDPTYSRMLRIRGPSLRKEWDRMTDTLTIHPTVQMRKTSSKRLWIIKKEKSSTKNRFRD